MRDSSYFSQDTIVAPITALGGAVAILRVSGPQALNLMGKLMPRAEIHSIVPRMATLVDLVSPRQGQKLDQALVSVFPAPGSFTGENVVECAVHGGVYSVQRILQTLNEMGVRNALPGEFSFRAVRNGKIRLSQAEAIADLIAAKNDRAIEVALEKLEGSQAKEVGEIGEELKEISAMGELGIDFSDQDIEEVALPALKARARKVLERLVRLRESFSKGSRIQEGVPLVFTGLPNVGKSSLFNSLLGEERAIVTQVPGTTRDLIKETVTLRGSDGKSVTLRLIDTAGIRDSVDPVERIGIVRAYSALEKADIILWVIDPRGSTSEWQAIWSKTKFDPAKTIAVLTHEDVCTEEQMEKCEEEIRSLGFKEFHWVSNPTGEGISALSVALSDFAQKKVDKDPGELVLTRLDHLESVEKGISSLERALSANDPALFASDVRSTLVSLSSLIGETLPDELLGRIFSKFCIGK